MGTTPTRLPATPPRATFSGEELEAYDRAVRRLAKFSLADLDQYKPDGYYGALLNIPEAADAISELAFLARSAGNREGTYSHADREWVDQVLSKEWGYYGVLGVHTPDAVALGVRIEAIEALWNDHEAELNADERLVTRYTRQVINGTVDDASWGAMLDRLGRRGLVEFTLFICHLQRVLRLFQAFGLPSPTIGELKQLISDINEGKVEIPDRHRAQRIGQGESQ